jgi:hypothetical protein
MIEGDPASGLHAGLFLDRNSTSAREIKFSWSLDERNLRFMDYRKRIC